MPERKCPCIRVGVRAPMSEHPSAGVRAPMSVHLIRCPSAYARASERRCMGADVAYVRASERRCTSADVPMSDHPSVSVRAPMSEHQW
ncbi:unnamed protein product [Cochlearia groenlandica]